MRDPARHNRTCSSDEENILPDAVSTVDVESYPSAAELLPGAMNLLPMGAAWGKPDARKLCESSTFAAMLRALLEPFADLYSRAFQLSLETRALTIRDSLEDWERDFGLPDDCISENATWQSRYKALLLKVRAADIATPRDFVLLAKSIGFDVCVEERWMFTCGFSHCGGEHVTGDVSNEAYWIVEVAEGETVYFTTGESVLGRDRLFEIVGATELICFLRQNSPAPFLPVFKTNN